MHSRIISCGLLIIPIILTSGQAVFAQDRPPKANIRVTLSVTERNGTTRMRASVGESSTLRIGETLNAYLYSSADGRAGGAGDNSRVRSGEGREHLWNMRMRPVETKLDSVTFEFDWQRFRHQNGVTEAAAGDQRILTLRQGERHVLDFITCSPEDSRLANAFVEIRSAPVEDPPYSDINLRYDLWLVQQAADGSKIARYFGAAARQGEKVPFTFESVPLPLETHAQGDSPLEMVVNGTIAGRATPDGSIQVALHSERLYNPHGGHGTWYSGTWYSGTKEFDTRSAETVRVDLPPDRGSSTLTADRAGRLSQPRHGVTTLDNGRVRVSWPEYFAGAVTSIIVTVHREN
jgi:hypothetical protein